MHRRLGRRRERNQRHRVERRHIGEDASNPELGTGPLTFEQLAQHYMRYELGDQTDSMAPKSPTTVERYEQVLNTRLIPRWGSRPALDIKVLEIEQWLLALKRRERLENPTLDKIRRVMSLTFKHGQRHGLMPEGHNPVKLVRCSTKSTYKARTITLAQTIQILELMQQPERTLTLLIAATGLRISECLGLQWADVDYVSQQICIRRTWIGQVGKPKTEASEGVVPMHPLLAAFLRAWQQESPYNGPSDWVFASTRLKGRQPRVANMLVEDHLRPAAVKAGVLVEGEKVRFGFHNLRHSLAWFLIRTNVDPKTVQELLRHADVRTTLQLYAHSVDADRMGAQRRVLAGLGLIN